jgi:hypothetical protein
MEEKMCRTCGLIKPVAEFHRSRRDGVGPHCRKCHNARNRAVWHADPHRARQYGAKWKRENPNRNWSSRLWYLYRLTLDRYEEMLTRQGGGCLICGTPDERGNKLSVHHDHRCCPGKRSCGECVVALLCGDCNRAEGLLRSDPVRVERLLGMLLAPPQLGGQVGLEVPNIPVG